MRGKQLFSFLTLVVSLFHQAWKLFSPHGLGSNNLFFFKWGLWNGWDCDIANNTQVLHTIGSELFLQWLGLPQVVLKIEPR